MQRQDAGNATQMFGDDVFIIGKINILAMKVLLLRFLLVLKNYYLHLSLPQLERFE